MKSLLLVPSSRNVPISNPPLHSHFFIPFSTRNRAFYIRHSRPSLCLYSSLRRTHTISKSQNRSDPPYEEEEDDDAEAFVQSLRVPDDWSLPSKALEESEWLRVALHKWLDEEYCPEETNVEISKVAASSYYNSLVEKKTELGDILLKMAIELESISYQESFHGAFSSANAAVNLIAQRIELFHPLEDFKVTN